ncbi:hypothetical protein LCGC14_0960430 [marine sediment metagenome]|uniref:Uncharacterized protein n=1 Tax=marine sediment metagenome TaxID=412755 RepID=A0A0F9NJE2_9ZZZZ
MSEPNAGAYRVAKKILARYSFDARIAPEISATQKLRLLGGGR